jgi:hypothetical protein
MSGENPKNDLHRLSALEAELAALVPRVDNLNRDRLMFLAGQASVESKASQATIQTPPPRLPARWAWPTAFAAAATVAASLLVALVNRPAPQVVERIVERIVSVPVALQQPAAEPHQDGVEPDPLTGPAAIVSAAPEWLTWRLTAPLVIGARHELSYPELRSQILSHGIAALEPGTWQSAAVGGAREIQILSRKQLNSLLEEDGVEPASRRPATPTSHIRKGANS